jgi:hypothetical protein
MGVSSDWSGLVPLLRSKLIWLDPLAGLIDKHRRVFFGVQRFDLRRMTLMCGFK